MSLYGLSVALALGIWTSVSIGARQNTRPSRYDTPHRTQVLMGMDGHHRDEWETILIRKPSMASTLVHAGNGWNDSMAERVTAILIHL